MGVLKRGVLTLAWEDATAARDALRLLSLQMRGTTSLNVKDMAG